MDQTLKTEIEAAIKVLAQRAAESGQSASGAQQFSQAAVNLSITLERLAAVAEASR